jgi:hypothetical protein
VLFRSTIIENAALITGNIINGNIELLSGIIYSNGNTYINGNTTITTGINGNIFKVSGNVYTDSTITIIADNTSITPINGNSILTNTNITTDGVINTNGNLILNYSNENTINSIFTGNFNLNSITNGSIYISGTLNFYNGGISINFGNTFFAGNVALPVNNSIFFSNIDRTRANISQISLTSGDVVINGNCTIGLGNIVTLNNGNIFITSGNIQYMTSTGDGASFSGNLFLESIDEVNININSLQTQTILGKNCSTQIYGNNTLNYTTNINSTNLTIYGNIYNSGNAISYNISNINAYGNILLGGNTLLNGNTLINGSITTSTINIESGNTYINNTNTISSTDSLNLYLTSGYFEKNDGTLILQGSTMLTNSYISGTFDTSGILRTIGNIITYNDISINGAINTIDASNIIIKGNSVISGSLNSTIKNITLSGTITNSGNISIVPLSRINLLSGFIDLSGTIVINGNAVTVENTGDIYYFTDLTQTYINPALANSSYLINAGDSIAIITAKRLTGYGNDNDTSYNITWTKPTTAYTNVYDFINGINSVLSIFTDPMTKEYLCAGMKLTATGNPDKKTAFVTLTIKINKKLLTKNYNIQFVPDTVLYPNSSFNKAFNIDVSMNIPFKLNSTVYDICAGNPISTINSDGTALIKGFLPIPVANNAIIFNTQNNVFYLRAYENGVYSKTSENDISFSIPITYENGILIKYSVDTLIYTINQVINSYLGILNITGTNLSTITVVENGNIYQYAKFRFSLKRTYNTSDFKLVFYDNSNFTKCQPGATSVQNITWDTTLGWLLGYNDSISYNFSSSSYSNINGYIAIVSDSVVILNLYNYFIICIDDHNASQINDGLVTLTGKDNNNPLPSYASRTNKQCDPVSGALIYNTIQSVDYSKLTQNQLYALTQITNTNQQNNAPDNKIYGNTPSIRNVFGILPIKPGSNGQTFVEYGGSLQNQDRNYYGPVNISKMSVTLMTDRGDVLNLNGANWSFSLISEQLSNLKADNSKK